LAHTNKGGIMSPHRQAAGTRINLFEARVFLFGQFILRAIALMPVMLYFAGIKLPFVPVKHALLGSLLLCLPLYLLLVFPFRFYAAGYISHTFAGSAQDYRISWKHYGLWLKAGLKRALCLFPWVLPAAALTALFYYYWNMTGFNEFGIAVNWLGGLVGGKLPEGSLVFCVVYGLSLLLAAHGWWRGTIFDYQPLSQIGLRLSRLRAKEAFKSNSGALAKVTLVNILICVPYITAILSIFYTRISQSLTGDIRLDLALLFKILQKGAFPAGTAETFLIALLLLYIPFILLRKGSNAILVTRVCALQNEESGTEPTHE
jgi:hypothetical protein